MPDARYCTRECVCFIVSDEELQARRGLLWLTVEMPPYHSLTPVGQFSMSVNADYNINPATGVVRTLQRRESAQFYAKLISGFIGLGFPKQRNAGLTSFNHNAVRRAEPMRRTTIVLVAMLVLWLCSPPNSDSWAQPSGAVSPDERTEVLLGLWGSEQSFGPMVRGELTIDARSPDWRADIAGYDASVEHANDEIHFALPGEAGKFRGHLSANGKRIAGHWIQLAGVGFYGSSYASPVELSAITPQVFRGDVLPLDEPAFIFPFKRLLTTHYKHLFAIPRPIVSGDRRLMWNCAMARSPYSRGAR
jgi:hypothetical protein